MAAFVNLSFEDEEIIGDGTGFPDGWTTTFTATAEQLASYDDATGEPENPFEGFDGGWDGNEDFIGAFADPVNLLELFPVEFDAPDLQSFEGFETKWNGNEGYLFGLGSSAAAVYNTPPALVEPFERQWDSNELFSFTMGGTVAALFDTAPEAVEDFEEGWSNDTFQFVLGTAQTADYYQTSGYDREDFEQVVDEHIFTADPSTDVLTSIGHGFTTAVRITFRNENGRLPTGLQPDSTYVVLASYTANTFQVSGVPAGPVIDILDNGTGTHFANNDPRNYWIGSDQMTTL